MIRVPHSSREGEQLAPLVLELEESVAVHLTFPVRQEIGLNISFFAHRWQAIMKTLSTSHLCMWLAISCALWQKKIYPKQVWLWGLARPSLVPSPTLESESGSPYIRSWVSVTSYYITKRIVSMWPFV